MKKGEMGGETRGRGCVITVGGVVDAPV